MMDRFLQIRLKDLLIADVNWNKYDICYILFVGNFCPLFYNFFAGQV